MNDIKQIINQVKTDVSGKWISIHESQKLAELISREVLVDFYRNALDTTSNEDISVQVENYINWKFGVKQ